MIEPGKTLLLVAAGGAAGAVARYLVVVGVGAVAGGGAFPFGTLTVNVVGSFILGALVEGGALLFTLGPELRAFVVVGVLGAFTTFSTFSMETVLLFERHTNVLAAAYVAASVVFSVGAFLIAMRVVRWLAP